MKSSLINEIKHIWGFTNKLYYYICINLWIFFHCPNLIETAVFSISYAHVSFQCLIYCCLCATKNNWIKVLKQLIIGKLMFYFLLSWEWISWGVWSECDFVQKIICLIFVKKKSVLIYHTQLRETFTASYSVQLGCIWTKKSLW